MGYRPSPSLTLHGTQLTPSPPLHWDWNGLLCWSLGVCIASQTTAGNIQHLFLLHAYFLQASALANHLRLYLVYTRLYLDTSHPSNASTTASWVSLKLLILRCLISDSTSNVTSCSWADSTMEINFDTCKGILPPISNLFFTVSISFVVGRENKSLFNCTS